MRFSLNKAFTKYVPFFFKHSFFGQLTNKNVTISYGLKKKNLIIKINMRKLYLHS